TDTLPTVVLPADYTFTPGDAGTHSFVGSVTLWTPPTQTATAPDRRTASRHHPRSIPVGLMRAVAMRHESRPPPRDRPAFVSLIAIALIVVNAVLWPSVAGAGSSASPPAVVRSSASPGPADDVSPSPSPSPSPAPTADP